MLLLTSLVDRQTGPAGVEHRLIITGATNRSKGRNREMRLFFAATVYERWLIAKNTYLERRKKLKWAIFKHCTLAPFRRGSSRWGGHFSSEVLCKSSFTGKRNRRRRRRVDNGDNFNDGESISLKDVLHSSRFGKETFSTW